MDRKEEEKEGEDKSQSRSIRERRRPREKRRSTGVSFWTQDVRHRSFFKRSSLIIISVTCNSSLYFQPQGDENDPDQQSDSEEGSIKGEPQVTRHTLKKKKKKSIKAEALRPKPS